jgi:hypothetical protein
VPAQPPTRRWPASNIQSSCPPEQGEGRLDFLFTGGFPGKTFVNCCQFVRCRAVSGAGKFCLDFERNLCQLLLPVLRPSRDAFQYCLNRSLVMVFYPILAGPFRTVF